MLKKHVEDFALFAGKPVFDSFRTTMSLTKPDKAKFLENAKISFEQMQLSNNGPNVRALEEELAYLHGVKYCIAFANCFYAMTLTIKAMALKGKKQVIVSPLTYRRMADIILWAGLQPHFCEVNDELYIDVKTIEPCINEDTALILLPHPITNIAPVDEVETLARKYALPLLIDSVEACGGIYKGKKIGSFGDAEAFSFEPSKVFNGGEGGYITTNNFDLVQKLRPMRSFGFVQQDMIECLGMNLKLNEIHAALARASFSDFAQVLSANKTQHLAYKEYLADIEGLELVLYDLSEEKNCKSCLVKLNEKWPLSRELTLELLNAEKIFARAYYYPALHTVSKERNMWDKELPNAKRLSEKYIILPMGTSVSCDDIKEISLVLKDILVYATQIIKKLKDTQYEKK